MSREAKLVPREVDRAAWVGRQGIEVSRSRISAARDAKRVRDSSRATHRGDPSGCRHGRRSAVHRGRETLTRMMRASNSRLEFCNSRDTTIASCCERSSSLYETEVAGGGVPQHANYSTLRLPTQRPSDRRFRGGLGKAGTAVTGRRRRPAGPVSNGGTTTRWRQRPRAGSWELLRASRAAIRNSRPPLPSALARYTNGNYWRNPSAAGWSNHADHHLQGCSGPVQGRSRVNR